MRIILIGIQGSGKSTQGNLLHEVLHLPYLSTGNIFRKIAEEKTKQSAYVKKIMNKGQLIPDEKVLEIVSDYLKRPEYQEGYILDGFPRTIHQAQSFADTIDKVFYLKLSDKEVLIRISKRASEKRADDTKSAIKKRIELFHTHTEPVLNYYREKGILTEVDGEQPIEVIFHQIIGHIEEQ